MSPSETGNKVRWSRGVLKWVIVLGVTLGIVVLLGLVKFFQVRAAIAQHMAFEMPPETVTSIVVAQEEWPQTLTAVGSVRPVNGLVLRADLPGNVVAIPFESGSTVKKGDLLVQQDVTEEQAQLRAAQAKNRLAEVNLQRFKGLLDKRVSSQSDYDQAAAEYLQSQARAEEISAVIAKKTIRAPFDGLAGIRKVNIGQYLQTGEEIVSVQSLDPIYVNFTLPQQELLKVKPGHVVRVKLAGTDKAVEGTITAIDSVIDEATRNFLVQATFKNPEGILRPGMFVQVEVVVPGNRDVLTVPATAISYAPYGDSVFVIEEMTDEKRGKTFTGVRQSFVKLGEGRGDRVEILSGIRPGDQIATSGIFKLRPNAHVAVNNSVQPGNELAPQPEDR